MASLSGPYSGRGATVRQLLRRLQSTWRRRAASARSRRAAAVSFGYDLQSYSQNFDDGALGY